MRGLIGDARWRFRTASGGRSIPGAARAGWRILRDDGPGALKQRIHYGARRLSHPAQRDDGDPPPHPWTQTFAHDAAFNPYFDLTSKELAANRAVIDAFDQRPQEVHTATWFLTYFEHVLFGGIYTILRLMAFMTARHGVQHRLVVFDRQDAQDEDLRVPISEAFPILSGIDIVLPVEGRIAYDELPPSDISICTMWISAFAQARFNDTKAKFYMVQDYEPAFYPAGTLSALAEATYRLGYAGIVNTPGLAEAYAAFGNPVTSFVPAVDHVSEPSLKPSTDGRPIQIVLYGRPGTDRNAFEVIASASRRIKERYGSRVRIVSAGEGWDPEDLGLNGVIENLGLLETLEDVQELYEHSDIGICFMLSKHPSYQPFEYLASGVAPICNVNPATSWWLQDEENCLIVEPFSSSVADAAARLIDDEELRTKIVKQGQEQVLAVDWDEQFDAVWRFIKGDA